jgi:hypothetical protein
LGLECLIPNIPLLLFQTVRSCQKKADGEDLAACNNNPMPPAMLLIKLVELIGIEPTTS